MSDPRQSDAGEVLRRLSDMETRFDLRVNFDLAEDDIPLLLPGDVMGVEPGYKRPFDILLHGTTAIIIPGTLIIEGEGEWESVQTNVTVAGASPAWVYATHPVDHSSGLTIAANVANSTRPVSSGGVHQYPLWELRKQGSAWYVYRSCLALHDILA